MDFDIKYLVFKKLRDVGYVVSPGIKFGCDFAVYEHGPGIDHAPYLVQVVDNRHDITVYWNRSCWKASDDSKKAIYSSYHIDKT